jgi:hypothetical protein
MPLYFLLVDLDALGMVEMSMAGVDIDAQQLAFECDVGGILEPSF